MSHLRVQGRLVEDNKAVISATSTIEVQLSLPMDSADTLTSLSEGVRGTLQPLQLNWAFVRGNLS